LYFRAAEKDGKGYFEVSLEMGLQQSDVLALIALLVSLVALVTTVLQVLQQYFSSAEGYRRCAESVVGKVWIRLFLLCYPAPDEAFTLLFFYAHCSLLSL
jgi:hypothetical protein